MIFLISLVLAIFMVGVSADYLRTRPVPFYLAAAAISVGVIFVARSGISLPEPAATWVWPVFSRGALAGSLFVLVMVTGAFPNGSFIMKKLMPVRGQLSILACILTLGHNAAYGKIYFRRLFTDPAGMPVTQRLAAYGSIGMLFIMLPLFVTSFPAIRKKMPAKRWKRLQRWAYLFYGLLYCHVLLLTLPYAMEGKRTYQVTVLVYSVIFISYGLCRICKAVAIRKKFQNTLLRWQAAIVSCCTIVLLGTFFLLVSERESTNAAPLSAAAEAVSDSEPVQKDIELEGTESQSGYRDGVYTGSAMGMNAQIVVSVTVTDGKLTDIVIDSSRDDEPYFSDALSVVDDMLEAGDAEVDTVSGATYSSGGIIDAVKAALAEAEE